VGNAPTLAANFIRKNIKTIQKAYKKLSCRKGTVQLLHGSVLAKYNWKTRYFAGIIGLSSTIVTKSTSKAIDFGDTTQNKDYYAVQGCSRSPISVPIESPYATSY